MSKKQNKIFNLTQPAQHMMQKSCECSRIVSCIAGSDRFNSLFTMMRHPYITLPGQITVDVVVLQVMAAGNDRYFIEYVTQEEYDNLMEDSKQ